MTSDAEQATAAMLARITDAPTRAGKVRALLDALGWMRSIQIDAKGAQPGHATRERAIFDITAVGLFFRALGRLDLAEDFQALASTLSDLDRGVVHKTLEEVSRKGGPTPLGSDIMRGRAYVAAAVDALHRAGLPTKKIKGTIDERQELRPLFDENKRKNERTLGDAAEAWRGQFNGFAVDNFEAVGTYKNCQGLLSKCIGVDDLKRCAEWLLLRAAMKASEVGRDFS
jgi:hypothetical protein